MSPAKIELAFPCGATFADMASVDATKRMCGACSTIVHDLSAMTESDARTQLRSTSERLCIRYVHDATGKVWFKEDLERASLISSSRLRKGARGVLAVASAVAAFVLTEACGGSNPFDSPAADASDSGDAGDASDAASVVNDAGSK